MAPSVLDRTTQDQGTWNQTPPPKKKRGCWFWGCMTLLALAVIAAIGIGVAAYMGFRYLKGFTSEKPADIPAYSVAPGEYEAVKARIEAFKTAVESGTSGAQLALSGSDINAVIASDQKWKDAGGKVRVDIVDDRISADVSIPLDGVAGLGGRYLNGSATVTASMRSGALFVALERLQVGGKEVPEEIMKALRGKNMAEELYKNPEAAGLMQKVQDLRVEGGKLILISK